MGKFSRLYGFGIFVPFLILNIIEYAIEHIRYLVYDSLLVGDAFEIIMTLFGGAVDFLEALIPVAVGAVMLIVFCDGGLLKSLITGGSLMLARFFYLIPHYYMTNIFLGYDSLESLGFGFLSSLGIILLSSIEVAICFLLGLLPCYKKAKRENEKMGDILQKNLESHEPLDVGNSVTAFVAILAAFMFLKMFAITTFDVISVLIKYSGSYPSRLLLPTILEYGFAVLVLLAAHFAGLWVIRLLTKK